MDTNRFCSRFHFKDSKIHIAYADVEKCPKIPRQLAAIMNTNEYKIAKSKKKSEKSVKILW